MSKKNLLADILANLRIGRASTETQDNSFATAIQNLAKKHEVPDQIYLMDAEMAGIETPEELRAFVKKTYVTGRAAIEEANKKGQGRLVAPSESQFDRIAAQLCATSKKRADYTACPPIAVLRQARAKQDVTKDGTSWFGGRPILGNEPWPRTTNGVPMHHWASIDLTELAAFERPPGMPDNGKLVFFAHAIGEPYEGKIIYVANADAPTTPPSDLPSIFFSSRFHIARGDEIKGNAPTEFLHWNIEFLALPMDDGEEGPSAQKAMADAFPDTANLALFTQSYAVDYLEATDLLLWDSMIRYAAKIARLETRLTNAFYTERKDADADVDGAAEKLACLKDCLNSLHAFSEEVQSWVAPHHKWDILAEDDHARLEHFRSYRLPLEKAPLGHEPRYTINSTNQAIGTIRDELEATFAEISGNLEALKSELHRKVIGIAETYRDIMQPQYWDSACRFAQKVTLAETHLDKTLEDARKEAEHGRKGADQKLDFLQSNKAVLREFIADVQRWVTPHNRWDIMTDDDRAMLGAFIARVKKEQSDQPGLGDYYPYRIIRQNIADIRDECDATFRAMARGPENLYQRLPQAIKDMLDKTHRLPHRFGWHQMFGEGAGTQMACEEHRYDHLLLQIHPDHMMNGVWDSNVVIQFWISAEDLSNLHWDKVTVTFESD